MSDQQQLLVLLGRLVDAQERIAAADERRNELLVADADERRESWARAQAEQREALKRLVKGDDVEP